MKGEKVKESCGKGGNSPASEGLRRLGRFCWSDSLQQQLTKHSPQAWRADAAAIIGHSRCRNTQKWHGL